MTHQGSPEDDLWNDCWTKMDDGDWVKTFHPKTRWEEGFGFYSFHEILDPPPAQILEPEYDLSAGVHTFYISGRSENLRIDRIHLWKKEDPFKVTFDNGVNPNQPESEKDFGGVVPSVMNADPESVGFSAQLVGTSADQVQVTLTNSGDSTLTISSVTLAGVNKDDFSQSYAGGDTELEGKASTNVFVGFSPTSSGSKSATLTIEHNGLNSPIEIPVSGSATTGGAGTTVLFRVNAGGPSISTGGIGWDEDQVAEEGRANGAAVSGNSHPYVNAVANGDFSFGRDDVVTLHSSVPEGTPMEIFQRGRWDPVNNPGMEWDIPIEEGKEIEVRLYFSEQLFVAPDNPSGLGWPRLFDVTIDGIQYPQFDDIDIYTEVGHDVGMMKSATIISDGSVDIDFVNISHDPIIQGIEILEVGGLSRLINDGWNMVSIPLTPANSGYESIFSAIPNVDQPFGFDGSAYVASSTLERGKGYWVKSGITVSQAFEGTNDPDLEIPLTTGWNLIGAPSCVFPAANISDIGGIMVPGTLFGFDDAYVATTIMVPGFGYWVKASGNGTIALECSAAPASKNNEHQPLANLERFEELSISDNAGKQRTLYFGGELMDETLAERFALPPKAPKRFFDVRYTDHSRLAEGNEAYVMLQGSDFPMTLEWTNEKTMRAKLYVEALQAGRVVSTHTLYPGQSIVLHDADTDGLRLSSVEEAVEAPEGFVLLGNYPNPFNPSTTVKLNLPEDAEVRVRVFDLLGRNVLEVPVQSLSAGASREVRVEAGDLASGTYIYRVEARSAGGIQIATGRMTLLK